MMTTRNSPLRINELSRITRTLFRQHHHGVGLFVLIATLFVLSFLAGLQPPMQFRVFMAGEVADSDVVAHRSLTVEDPEAAKIKRNQVAMLQPTVFDLSVTEIAALRQKIFGMLKLINGQETSPEAQDALRASLAEKLATPVSADLLAQWMSPEVQEYVLSTGLPWFEDRLREGVVGDVRLALPSKNGIIVRDVDTKAETLRPDVSDIRDVPAVLAAFTQKLRSAEKLTPQGRRAVLVLFSPLIMPTLTLNREAAIVMLADAVEASSRTLTDPTPARIKTHIDTIMKGIFSEGQLDESELTFKDLHKLSESFARILTGLFHQRIAYPDLNKDKKTASDKPEQAKVQAKPEEKTEQRPDVKRTVAYAASSVMPGSSGAAAPNGPEQQGAAPAAPHTPVSPSANPGPPIDLVYPVVPGPPKPVNKGPLSMKPVGKRP